MMRYLFCVDISVGAADAFIIFHWDGPLSKGQKGRRRG